MAIVDETYYNDTYYGEPVATADFPRYDARAETAIALITRGLVTADNLDDFPECIQTAYKNAICAQIEYYAINGIYVSSSGLDANDYTIGNISVRGNNTKSSGFSSSVCPASLALLEQTGLLNPQVGTLEPQLVPFWFGGVYW